MTPKKPQAGHTPGPWKIRNHSRVGIKGVWIESSDMVDGVVVGTSGVAVIPEYWLANEDDKSANANLIAAAPDLLATLHNCLSRLQMDLKYVSTQTGREEIEAYMVEARAAIAKAEGRGAR